MQQQMRRLTLVILFVALTFQFCLCQVPVNSTRLPFPRKAMSAAAVGDRVLFIGGYAFHDSAPSDKIDVFDAINQTWSNSLSLPKARGYVSPVVVDSNIYFLGGITRTNSPFLYVSSNHSFVPVGSGPTVRTPKQLSVFGSYLTVVGSFSVDFLDLDSGNWTYNANLTAIMMSRKESIVFAYQELVFVIGGADLETNETFNDAWIFSTQTNELRRYMNIMTYNPAPLGPFTFDVSENVVVVRLADRCLLYHQIRDQWFEQEEVYNIIHSVTLNNITFLFGDNIDAYDWNEIFDQEYEDVDVLFGNAVNGTVFYILDEELIFLGGPRLQRTGLRFLGPIRFAQQWTATKYVFVDNTKFYVVDSELQDIITIASFSTIYSMFVTADGNIQLFDSTNTLTWHTILPTQYPAVDSSLTLDFLVPPTALVNGDFVSLSSLGSGAFSVNDPTTIYPLMSFRDAILTAQDGNSFVVMNQFLPLDSVEYYKHMDIYNTENDTWTTVDMPEELFIDPRSKMKFLETFMTAAAVNDGTIMAWSPGAFALYDVELGEWTAYNSSLEIDGRIPIKRAEGIKELHYEVPVINDFAYLPSDGLPYFFKFAPDLLDFTTTSPVPTTDATIQQPVASREKLYVSMRSGAGFDALYIYDLAQQTWQLTLLPEKTENMAISASEDYIVVVGSNGKLQILSVQLGGWNVQDIEFETSTPSAIIHVGNVTLVAGGELPSQRYADGVLIISDDIVFIPPVASTPLESVVPATSPGSGLTEGQLAAAILVPILVVLGAGVALLLILLKKRRKAKRKTTFGLEGRFGEWFTPFSDIQFGEQLGQGANGQVFKGKWKNTDVALKVSMTQANQSVLDELSLMINLRPHPNVVQLFGYSVHPETNGVILILEYCNGGALDDYLGKQSTALTTAQKVQMLQGIARGVVHLHSNHIVHRDLAARNVLLHQGEPKITDFGMSRVVDEQQRGTTKSELGPIRWMAPESLKSKQYSTKSDVWSFGIVMYEVMEQQEPHANADPIAIGRQIRDEGLAPTIDSSSSCPSSVSSLMQRCWEKDSEKRPTMDVVLQALEQIN